MADERKGMVRVQLISDQPLSLNGDITGRLYIFRNHHDILFVDKRDAISMVNIKALLVTF